MYSQAALHPIRQAAVQLVVVAAVSWKMSVVNEEIDSEQCSGNISEKLRVWYTHSHNGVCSSVQHFAVSL